MANIRDPTLVRLNGPQKWNTRWHPSAPALWVLLHPGLQSPCLLHPHILRKPNWGWAGWEGGGGWGRKFCTLVSAMEQQSEAIKTKTWW